MRDWLITFLSPFFPEKSGLFLSQWYSLQKLGLKAGFGGRWRFKLCKIRHCMSCWLLEGTKVITGKNFQMMFRCLFGCWRVLLAFYRHKEPLLATLLILKCLESDYSDSDDAVLVKTLDEYRRTKILVTKPSFSFFQAQCRGIGNQAFGTLNREIIKS
jgi:hypothetical protein